MSDEIAFKPEDAVGLPSQIAWTTEEATIPRYIRRQMKKGGDRIYRFVCMTCGYGEMGGYTSFVLTRKDAKTGKEFPVRIHRACPKCNGNMVKINEEKEEKKKWLKK